MRRAPRISLRANEGFTLLEMLVVLAIISGIAAFTLPNVWRRPPDLALRDTALDMAAMMRATRAGAIRANGERAFEIDPSNRRYWSDIAPAPRAIPAVLSIGASFRAEAQNAGKGGRVAFYADGTASGGSIVLREGQSSATIAVDWLTGNATVDWSR